MKLTDGSRLIEIRKNNRVYCLLILSLHGSGLARSGEMELRSNKCPILYWRSRLQIASEASPGNRAGLNLACERFDRSSRLTGPARLSGLARLHVNRLLNSQFLQDLAYSCHRRMVKNNNCFTFLVQSSTYSYFYFRCFI